MKLQDIRLLNNFKISLPSIHRIHYIYIRFIFLLIHQIIFIMILEKILLVKNFANL